MMIMTAKVDIKKVLTIIAAVAALIISVLMLLIQHLNLLTAGAEVK